MKKIGLNLKKKKELNNTYIVTGKTIKEVLNGIDEFTSKMNKFKEKYNNYNYSVSITKNNELWDAEIKINNEEQNNTEAFKEAIQTPTLS